jgi:hypothetical protein
VAYTALVMMVALCLLIALHDVSIYAENMNNRQNSLEAEESEHLLCDLARTHAVASLPFWQ